jgi:hypothetical protein
MGLLETGIILRNVYLKRKIIRNNDFNTIFATTF